MKMEPLPKSEFERRIRMTQEALSRQGLDVLITYSSETESASSRYLADFWPFFDFAGVIVPAEGEAALITGGPESFEFAQRDSKIDTILINPLYVELSAPEWEPDVEGESFKEIFKKVCKDQPKKIGICDWSIFPHTILKDIIKAAPQAEIVPADDLLLGVRAVKADIEIPYIETAYTIAEQAMKTAIGFVDEGVTEKEIEAAARIKMLELGAEGMPYPAWVCSGPNTVLSLSRSTDRKIKNGDLVQLTLGSKFMGYCGNMCRALMKGSPPAEVKKLMDAALEATEYALQAIKPGVIAREVYKGHLSILKKYGFEEFALYGPAHGTGYSEVEGLWLSESADFVIQENMLFNIDIWLSDGTYGMRYEEGVIVVENGVKQLNPSYRQILTK